MPLHENSIAALNSSGVIIPAQRYYFIDLQGTPQFAQQQKEYIQRAGVNGTYARKLGVRGEPFTIVSKNYVPTFLDCANLMALYRGLTDLDYGVRLTQYSVTHEAALDVVHVAELEKFAVANVVGGFFGGELACQIVRWTLRAS